MAPIVTPSGDEQTTRLTSSSRTQRATDTPRGSIPPEAVPPLPRAKHPRSFRFSHYTCISILIRSVSHTSFRSSSTAVGNVP
jgi:hypothetical protein